MNHLNEAQLEIAVCDWLKTLLFGKIDLPAGQTGERLLEQIEVP